MSKKLVIVGAGIGGLSVINEIRRSATPVTDLDITIIDEDFSHFLGFTLPWVMRGWRDEDSIPIRPTAEALSGITTITARVTGVDPDAKIVTLADNSEIGYDALVLAAGSRIAIEMIPGLPEAVDSGSAVHYYATAAAASAHRALSAFAGGKLVFLITSQPYRCPVAPYEGALLAADLLREKGTRAATQVAIYTPEQQPMPSAGPYAGPELVRLLNREGIDVYCEQTVERIDPDGRTIHFQDGQSVDFDLLVFIPPHQPAITLGQPGWIAVDSVTMQTPYSGIWAVGDITAITCPWGKPLPKAAIFAKNGAAAAATNVLNYLGQTDDSATLSGRGYCYIDTGARHSAMGSGDFFALPDPGIHLTPPSGELHHDKHDEERDWRAMWERRWAGVTGITPTSAWPDPCRPRRLRHRLDP
ncbi:MAG: NAD(P)/FAD-dependent oxidoreductase [Mycobacterium pseudokansasii]|nr:NAD(P)/FAD-dependent oxidoreductase [Mycobacterium pseudokansasii]